MIRKDAILSLIVGCFLTGLVGMNQRVFSDSLYGYHLHRTNYYSSVKTSDSEKLSAKGIILVVQQQEEKQKILPPAEGHKGSPKRPISPKQKKLEPMPPNSGDQVPKREAGKQQSGRSTSIFPGCSPSK